MSWSMDRPLWIDCGGPQCRSPVQLPPGDRPIASARARRRAARTKTPPSGLRPATSPLVLRKSGEDQS